MVKTIPVPCSKEEIDRIIDAAAGDEFYYTLFMVAKTTGRRLGEYYGEPEMKTIGRKPLIKNGEPQLDKNGKPKMVDIKERTGRYIGGVQVKDINFEKGVMMTQVLKKRRNHSGKEAVLTDEVSRLLRQYVLRNKLKDDDYVFRKVSYRQIQNAITSYAKKSNVNHNVSFHNFRHYFVTELYKKGLTYDQIAKLTGHSSPTTLLHYDHSVASELKGKVLDALQGI